jgi:hypothetical protein
VTIIPQVFRGFAFSVFAAAATGLLVQLLGDPSIREPIAIVGFLIYAITFAAVIGFAVGIPFTWSLWAVVVKGKRKTIDHSPV